MRSAARAPDTGDSAQSEDKASANRRRGDSRDSGVPWQALERFCILMAAIMVAGASTWEASRAPDTGGPAQSGDNAGANRRRSDSLEKGVRRQALTRCRARLAAIMVAGASSESASRAPDPGGSAQSRDKAGANHRHDDSLKGNVRRQAFVRSRVSFPAIMVARASTRPRPRAPDAGGSAQSGDKASANHRRGDSLRPSASRLSAARSRARSVEAAKPSSAPSSAKAAMTK